jgi:hypothetical protein
MRCIGIASCTQKYYPFVFGLTKHAPPSTDACSAWCQGTEQRKSKKSDMATLPTWFVLHGTHLLDTSAFVHLKKQLLLAGMQQDTTLYLGACAKWILAKAYLSRPLIQGPQPVLHMVGIA